MGYEVTTNIIFGFKFATELHEHNEIDWDNGEFDEENDLEENEIQISKLIQLANKHSLDVDYDHDGESGTIDMVYVGLLVGVEAQQIIDKINHFQTICTPELIEEIVSIMDEEPIIGEEKYQPIYGRTPILHTPYDKSW